MDNKQEFMLFCAAKTAADIIVESITELSKKLKEEKSDDGLSFIDDRRRFSPNPYYDQVNGLMLKFYYSSPAIIMTPWGQWEVGYCSGSGIHLVYDTIFNKLGSRQLVPVKNTSEGQFGPIYSITNAGRYNLPVPSPKPRPWISYDDAKEKWKSMEQRYSKGERSEPVILEINNVLPPTNDDIVKLKSGKEVSRLLAIVMFQALVPLLNKEPIAFFDLVSVCRNPDHRMSDNSKAILARWKFTDDFGQIDISTQEFVLECVTGEGIKMRIVNPFE